MCSIYHWKTVLLPERYAPVCRRLSKVATCPGGSSHGTWDLHFREFRLHIGGTGNLNEFSVCDSDGLVRIGSRGP